MFHPKLRFFGGEFSTNSPQQRMFSIEYILNQLAFVILVELIGRLSNTS